MKLKKNITKITALAGTAAMALSAVATPVSADLGDLPQPYVEDGEFVGKLVIGDNADPADLLGAIDIAAGFQAESTTPVTVSGGGMTTIAGGELIDEENLNEYFDAEELDDRDLDGFQDSSTRFDGTDIDFEELFSLTDAEISTSLSENRQSDDFEGDAFLTLEERGALYQVVMKDDVNLDVLGTGSDEEELDLPFLGTDLEITDVRDNRTLTVSTSREFFLEEGDSVEVDGRTVELLRVGQRSVRVSVDGETRVISENDDERFRNAGNFRVEVDGSPFYIEGADDNGVNLKMGEDITRTVENGDGAVLFGEPDDRREAQFVWAIDLNKTGDTLNEGSSIGLALNWDHVELEDLRPRSGEGPALAEGEALTFPNNYVDVTFEGLDIDRYEQISVEAFSGTERMRADDPEDDVDLEWGYIIEADEALIEAGDEDTEILYLGYVDESDDFQMWTFDGSDNVPIETTPIDDASFDTDVRLDLRDEVTVLLPEGDLSGVDLGEENGSLADFDSFVDAHLAFEFGGGDESLALIAEKGNDYFGEDDREASTDLKYFRDGFDVKGIGNEDFDQKTTYGVFIEDTENQFDGGSTFEMLIPDERQTGTVSVTTRASQVERSSGETDSGAVEVNRAPVGLGVLASEAQGLLGTEPMVVVGGPYVNEVASTLLDNPTDDEIEQMFSPGMAKIHSFEDEQALLVAGYNAEDTVRASQVVANFRDHSDELHGDEVELVFDGSDDITFQQPTEVTTEEDDEAEE